MRLFLDANIVTYMAFFEGFLVGDIDEPDLEAASWREVYGADPDSKTLREIVALRGLFELDDRARFDWLISDVAVQEISAIRSVAKLRLHGELVLRLLEHREDVLEYLGRPEVDRLRSEVTALFPQLPTRMLNDALQYVEASFFEADYFVTNDEPFIRTVERARGELPARRPSQLRF